MALARKTAGFTLIEVLIALSVTAVVATIAYSSLSAVINGLESSQQVAARTYEINRAWMIVSRDIRQFVNRPVRDEFGDLEPAMYGGPAARFMLSFTRGGWHNSAGHRRSNLQRVNYLVENETLWRESYPVLDRAADTVPQRVELLAGVEDIQLRFLRELGSLERSSDGKSLDMRNWEDSWVAGNGVPGAETPPPIAVEIRLLLEDWGELRRVYELSPL